MASNSISKRDKQEWDAFCERVQSTTAVVVGERPEDQEKRRKKALKDYNYFAMTYFPLLCDEGQTPCAKFHIDAANAILKDPTCIACLEWPREHAKSVHATIIIPMWLLAHNEISGIVIVSKDENGAVNLLSDLQAQLQFNKLFAHDFGEEYNQGNWETGDFVTKSGYRCTALGRGQSPRGLRNGHYRPNFAVVDDIDDNEIVNNLQRVRKVVDWIFGALYFALYTKASRMIFANNRIHPKGIFAHVVGDITPSTPKRDGIYHSKVTAIQNGKPAWPERYSLQELEHKIKVGGMQARVEFFHEHHIKGSVFKEQYFRWKPMPMRSWSKDFKVIVGYFDPSFENKQTSDYKAIRIWGLTHDDERHLLKSFARKTDFQVALNWMADVEEKLPTGCAIIWYIEKQFISSIINNHIESFNKSRIQQGRRPLYISIDERKKEEKYTRIVRMQPLYYNGKITFNELERNDPDMIEGNNQLLGIEPGYRGADDSPDADEGAWYYLEQHITSTNFRPTAVRHSRKSW